MPDIRKNYFQRRTKPKGPRSNYKITSSEVQVITNDGENANQEVSHFHVHVLGGENLRGLR